MLKKIYVCGPMTGLPDLNFPAFHAAAARLRSVGYEVVNPAEVNPDVGMSWIVSMRRNIPELLRCDVIALLPGWGSSTGARLEVHIAREVRIQVETVETLFYEGRARQSGEIK